MAAEAVGGVVPRASKGPGGGSPPGPFACAGRRGRGHRAKRPAGRASCPRGRGRTRRRRNRSARRGRSEGVSAVGNGEGVGLSRRAVTFCRRPVPRVRPGGGRTGQVGAMDAAVRFSSVCPGKRRSRELPFVGGRDIIGHCGRSCAMRATDRSASDTDHFGPGAGRPVASDRSLARASGAAAILGHLQVSRSEAWVAPVLTRCVGTKYSAGLTWKWRCSLFPSCSLGEHRLLLPSR